MKIFKLSLVKVTELLAVVFLFNMIIIGIYGQNYAIAGQIAEKTADQKIEQKETLAFKAQVHSAVQSYLKKQIRTKNPFKSVITHPDCAKRQPLCVDTACNQLGNFACDDRDEVMELAQACRGNFNGLCLEKTCALLKPFGCDEQAEVVDHIAACTGNLDSLCLESVCQRLAPYGCDEVDEIHEVAIQCGGQSN